MGFNGQEKLAVLLVRRGVGGHTQHMLLARAVNIGIEQAHRQPLLALSAAARFVVTVDLPTPPFPEATATTWRGDGTTVFLVRRYQVQYTACPLCPITPDSENNQNPVDCAPSSPDHARMSAAPRKILVTSALPYANAPLHLGHMLEQVQTDIWVRFQRSRGHHCRYVCADDAHGTAIMLSAEAANRTPEAHIAAIQARHERDSAGFLIDLTTTTRRTRLKISAGPRPFLSDYRLADISPCVKSHRPMTRKRTVPCRPLYQRHLPKVQGSGSIRRQL
jgi:hypothetical protein